VKTLSILGLVFASLLVALAARGADSDPVPEEAKPKNAFVIAESLGGRTNAVDDYVRLEAALKKLANERKWPVEVVIERFAANVPDYENEVTIFTQPVRQEVPGEYVLRGWTTLVVAGKKFDFGILRGEYRPFPGEQIDQALEKLFREFALEVGDRIEMAVPFVRREGAGRKP
jgi:hypothetical protein